MVFGASEVRGAPVIAVAFCLVIGCSVPGSLAGEPETIAVEIPSLPEIYHPLEVAWQIRWWDGTAVQSRTMAVQGAGETRSLTLPLAREGAELVVVEATAYPVGGGVLAPLGAWGAAPRRRFTPDADFGRAASAVLQVAHRGLDPALINMERLHRTVLEECQDQPETLDHDRLVAALGSGEMTRYAIRRRQRPGCEVSLPAPVDDTWISHDTSERQIEGVWAGDQCYWMIPVAAGEVRHLWQGPAGRLLTVGRDRDGHAFWFISPPHSRAYPVRRLP